MHIFLVEIFFLKQQTDKYHTNKWYAWKLCSYIVSLLPIELIILSILVL